MRGGKGTSKAALLLLGLAAASAPAAAQTYDILMRGGTIYDGSGKPGYVGDVAVSGGKIAAVGKRVRGSAAKLIEARGSGINYACYVGHNGIRAQVMPGVQRPANPGAFSTGITAVIVNGKVAFENGRPTSVTAGRFVPRKHRN